MKTAPWLTPPTCPPRPLQGSPGGLGAARFPRVLKEPTFSGPPSTTSVEVYRLYLTATSSTERGLRDCSIYMLRRRRSIRQTRIPTDRQRGTARLPSAPFKPPCPSSG